MNDDPEPTLQLLALLIGKRTAKRLYRGSLTELFLDDAVSPDVKMRLQATRELVQRWMLEDMRRQLVLHSRNQVVPNRGSRVVPMRGNRAPSFNPSRDPPGH